MRPGRTTSSCTPQMRPCPRTSLTCALPASASRRPARRRSPRAATPSRKPGSAMICAARRARGQPRRRPRAARRRRARRRRPQGGRGPTRSLSQPERRPSRVRPKGTTARQPGAREAFVTSWAAACMHSAAGAHVQDDLGRAAHERVARKRGPVVARLHHVRHRVGHQHRADGQPACARAGAASRRASNRHGARCVGCLPPPQKKKVRRGAPAALPASPPPPHSSGTLAAAIWS